MKDLNNAQAAALLKLPLLVNPVRAQTMRDYLARMAEAAWRGEFSEKYGFTGESDWKYDLYYPMIAACFFPGITLDDEGLIPDELSAEWEKLRPWADRMITQAIRIMCRGPEE